MTTPRRPLLSSEIWGRSWFALSTCVALAFAVYGSALGNEFAFDDASFLCDAKAFRDRPLELFTISTLGWYRPLWSFYVWLNYRIFELNAIGYFATGILVHGVTAFLVWKLARRMGLSVAASWAAGLTFLAFLSHSETSLWMAAQNSTIVITFGLAAVVVNVCSRESSAMRIWLPPFLVFCALLTKETGIVAIAWVPLAEFFLLGRKSFFNRRALARYGLLAIVACAYLWLNPWLQEAASLQSPEEARIKAGHASFSRWIGTFYFLVSPIMRPTNGTRFWTSAILIVAFFTLVYTFRRDFLRQSFFAIALALIGLGPSLSMLYQMGTPFRLYYGATVGAGLCIGILLDLATSQRVRQWIGIAVLAYAIWNATSIRWMNLNYYQPSSIGQTNCAKSLEPYLATSRPAPILLTEPPINNLYHLQKFLELLYGIPESEIKMFVVDEAVANAWLPEAIRNGSVALRFNDRGVAQETREFPPHFDPGFRKAQGFDTPPETVKTFSAYLIVRSP